LAKRIVDASGKPSLLFLVADLEPYLDQQHPTLHHVPLEQRAQREKSAVLLLRTESHHMLDAGAVVPAPIEDDDFARGGEMREIALHVHLRLLAVRGCGQCDDPKDTRAYPLGDGLDRAAFAGGIASFEDDDHAQSLRFDPLLQHTQSALQLLKLLFVLLPLHGCHPPPRAR
jgi:hypothetical protein